MSGAPGGSGGRKGGGGHKGGGGRQGGGRGGKPAAGGRPRGAAHGGAAQQPVGEGEGSFLSVRGERHPLRNATLTVGFGVDDEGRKVAELDLYAEGLGRGQVGIAIDHLTLAGVEKHADLEGRTLIDPPPGLLSIGSLAAAARQHAEARKRIEEAVSAAKSGGHGHGDHGDDHGEHEHEHEHDCGCEEHGPAAEAIAAAAATADPLEPTAITEEELEELWEDYERLVIAPGMEIELARVRIVFGRPHRRRIPIILDAEGELYGDEGVEATGIPVHAELSARLELVDA